MRRSRVCASCSFRFAKSDLLYIPTIGDCCPECADKHWYVDPGPGLLIIDEASEHVIEARPCEWEDTTGVKWYGIEIKEGDHWLQVMMDDKVFFYQSETYRDAELQEIRSGLKNPYACKST